jgi:MFS family permease
VPADAAEDARIGRTTWLALAAMALGVFVIANDFTALSVAIPRIEAQLHTSLNAAQWVINGYALVFGVVIVTGGRLADLRVADSRHDRAGRGRRAVLLLGHHRRGDRA